jgi:hypothetical protein
MKRAETLDYILMEYLRGSTLDRLLAEKRKHGAQLSVLEFLEFASHVAKALIYTHKPRY